MTLIRDIIKEEYLRLNNLIQHYTTEIAKYPKGSLSMKRISGKEYFYLAYREKGEKTILKIIKKEDLDIYNFLTLIVINNN